MDPYRLIVVPSGTRTRLLLTHGPDELLRAILPAPQQMRHERAATTFIEGLSLWFDVRMRVVLCADAQAASFCLGLTDEMGQGERGVYHEVAVVDPARRQRRVRVTGVGDFTDLRQLGLSLVPDERR